MVRNDASLSSIGYQSRGAGSLSFILEPELMKGLQPPHLVYGKAEPPRDEYMGSTDSDLDSSAGHLLHQHHPHHAYPHHHHHHHHVPLNVRDVIDVVQVAAAAGFDGGIMVEAPNAKQQPSKPMSKKKAPFGKLVHRGKHQASLDKDGNPIKRPLNSFMLYRRAKQEEIQRADPNLNHHSSVSRVVGQLWRNESAEVKAHYAQLAELERQRHAKDYPGWKFKPRKRVRHDLMGNDIGSPQKKGSPKARTPSNNQNISTFSQPTQSLQPANILPANISPMPIYQPQIAITAQHAHHHQHDLAYCEDVFRQSKDPHLLPFIRTPTFGEPGSAGLNREWTAILTDKGQEMGKPPITLLEPPVQFQNPEMSEAAMDMYFERLRNFDADPNTLLTPDLGVDDDLMFPGLVSPSYASYINFESQLSSSLDRPRSGIIGQHDGWNCMETIDHELQEHIEGMNL